MDSLAKMHTNPENKGLLETKGLELGGRGVRAPVRVSTKALTHLTRVLMHRYIAPASRCPVHEPLFFLARNSLLYFPVQKQVLRAILAKNMKAIKHAQILILFAVSALRRHRMPCQVTHHSQIQQTTCM